jgi:CRISPR-associated protein Cmr3
MAGIARWISGSTPLPEQFVDSRSLWRSEVRTGVGLQAERRTNKSGMLYTFGFVRLERGVSIGFELAGGQLQPDCYVRFGGENRLARLEHGPSLTQQLATKDIHTGDSVYALLAPAIYDKGSYPEGSVSAAVVDGPLHIGGWDLARRGPKRLRRAVPGGSVYWMDDGPSELLGSLSDQQEEGFGLMLRGSRPRR